MCFALTLLLATYFSLEMHSQDFIVGFPEAVVKNVSAA